MAIIAKPYSFTANTTASASQVNDNFDTLYNEFNGAISSANLATNAVTTAKIADGNITTAKIADSATTTAKINDLAVTTGKLADGSVTSAKLAPIIIHKESTGSAVTTGSPVDVPGCTATFTVEAASVAIVRGTFYGGVTVNEAGALFAQLDVDAGAKSYNRNLHDSTDTADIVAMAAEWVVPLAAGSHTLKLIIDTTGSQDATVQGATMTIMVFQNANSTGTSTAN